MPQFTWNKTRFIFCWLFLLTICPWPLWIHRNSVLYVWVWWPTTLITARAERHQLIKPHTSFFFQNNDHLGVWFNELWTLVSWIQSNNENKSIDWNFSLTYVLSKKGGKIISDQRPIFSLCMTKKLCQEEVEKA